MSTQTSHGTLFSRISNISERTELQQLRTLVKTLMEQNFQLMERIEYLIRPIKTASAASIAPTTDSAPTPKSSPNHHEYATTTSANRNPPPPPTPSSPQNHQPDSPYPCVNPFLGAHDSRTPIQFLEEFERLVASAQIRTSVFGKLLQNDCKQWWLANFCGSTRGGHYHPYETVRNEFLRTFWSWDRQYAECQLFREATLDESPPTHTAVNEFLTHWMSRLRGNELISQNFVLQVLMTKLPPVFVPILLPFIEKPVLSEIQKALLQAQEYVELQDNGPERQVQDGFLFEEQIVQQDETRLSTRVYKGKEEFVAIVNEPRRRKNKNRNQRR